jgi:dihydrofolate reductase
VTHAVPDKARLAGRFTFVTDGIEDAISRAAQAAGDRDVFIIGGARVIEPHLSYRIVHEDR